MRRVLCGQWPGAAIACGLGVILTGSASAATWISSSGGAYGTAANWQAGDIADSSTEVALFPAALGSGAITVSLASNYTIGQLDIDGAVDVTLDLDGHTYRASAQNAYIRNGATATLTDGVFTTAGGASPRELRVEQHSTLHVENADVYAFGGLNGVVVNGTLELESGSLNSKQDPSVGSSTRDFYLGATGVLAYEGGTVSGRYIQWQNGSEYRIALPSGGMSTAPVSFSDVRALGDLAIELPAGFTATVGTTYEIVELTYPNTGSYSFANVRFDNAADGAQITVGDYVFEVDYTNSVCSLEVVQVNTAPPAGSYTFTNTSGGSYQTASNWSTGYVPASGNPVLFGTGLDGATISFSADADAQNIDGDSGAYSVDFALGGNTWSLVSQSKIKGDYTFTNGDIESTAEFQVESGGVLTLGSGAALKATGGLNEIKVMGGGEAIVAGGTLGHLTYTRDINVQSGGELTIIDAGSVVTARYAQLQDGSTLSFTLPAGGYTTPPLAFSDVRALGDLSLAIESGFSAQVDDEFPLVSLSFPQSAYGFDNIRFDNTPGGSQVVIGDYTFQANYTNNSLTLKVVAVGGGTPTPLDGRVESVVEMNYYTSETAADVMFDITPGSLDSGLVAKVVVDLPGSTDLVATQAVTGTGLTVVSVPLSGVAVGEYPVSLTILDGTTAVWSDTDTLVKRSAPPTGARLTQVDRYRRTLVVDGDPYFPIGIYGIFPQYLSDVATNTKLNWTTRWKGATVWPRWDRSKSATDTFNRQDVVRDYLDAVQTAGLHNPATGQGLYVFENAPKLAEKTYYIRFNDVEGRYPNSSPYWDDKYPVHNGTITPGVVQNAKDHPAVIGYYNYDEPDNFYPDDATHPLHQLMQPGVEAWYDVVHGADPYHPVLSLFAIGLGGSKQVADWDAHDMVGRDVYIGTSQHMSYVYNETRDSHAIAWDRGLPYFLTPLAEKSDGRPVPMSPEEQRASTYLAVAADVKGVTYWEWPVAYGPSWEMVKDLADELSELSPVLLERAPTQTIAYTNSGTEDSIKALVKNHGGRSYLIVVNAESAPVSVTFTLPSRFAGQTQVMFESRTVSLTSGSFTDSFSPYGRHVYELPSGITWVAGETLSLAVSKGADVVPADPNFPSDPVNHVVNSSFEEDYGRLPGWPFGWAAGSSIMESGTIGTTTGRWTPTTTGSPTHGSRCLRLIKDTAGVGNSDDISNILGVVPEAIVKVNHPVTGTSTYTLSVDLKVADTDTKVGIIVNGLYLTQFRPTHTNWQRYWFNAYNVYGPKDVDIRIQLLGKGSGPSTLYIDRVQVEQGNVTGTSYSYTPPS